MSDTWKTAIIEGSMVLVGVLLALFVDSWREQREFQDLVEVSESQIIEEIGTNRQRLITFRENFERRDVRLEEWGDSLDTNQGLLAQLDGFPGIPGIFISRSAWTMANNSQITEYLNHEFYDDAFQLYAFAESLEDRLDLALGLLFDVRGFDENFTTDLLQILKLYFEDFIDNTDDLIRRHDSFLEEFGLAP